MTTPRIVIVCATLFTLGCPSEGNNGVIVDSGLSANSDLGADDDTAMTVADSGSDSGVMDQGARLDGSTGDAGVGVCEGECATLDVTATIAPNAATFERAYFGITAEAQSESGQRELHIEAYVGGVDGCPDENSPTPDQTLIVTGMPSPRTGALYTRQDGLALSVLDFEGTLISDGVVAKAVEASTSVVFFDDSLVSIDVEAALEGGGEVVGRIFAEHCDSLDVE